MVNALGVTGYEGVFRCTCEVTLRVLREERDSLLNVLRTFIYDPLVEWSIRRGLSSTDTCSEVRCKASLVTCIRAANVFFAVISFSDGFTGAKCRRVEQAA